MTLGLALDQMQDLGPLPDRAAHWFPDHHLRDAKKKKAILVLAHTHEPRGTGRALGPGQDLALGLALDPDQVPLTLGPAPIQGHLPLVEALHPDVVIHALTLRHDQDQDQDQDLGHGLDHLLLIDREAVGPRMAAEAEIGITDDRFRLPQHDWEKLLLTTSHAQLQPII